MTGDQVGDARLAGVIARVEVRELVDAYADAVNTRDEQRWAATWHPEAVWDLGRARVEGRPAIVALWRDAMGAYEHVIQMVGHGGVTPDGSAGRWTIWELGRKDGANTLVVGCYRDRYTHDGTRWYFAERNFTVTYRAEMPPADFGAFPPNGIPGFS